MFIFSVPLLIVFSLFIALNLFAAGAFGLGLIILVTLCKIFMAEYAKFIAHKTRNWAALGA